jgi:LAGLIDADG DNA endonuclease family.
MSIIAEGFFIGGLKLFISYVFYKIKDASNVILFTGEKNNTYLSYNWLAQVKDTGYSLRSKSHKFTSLEFKKGFHTKIRASSRIGPHNQDVLSVIIGSLLGDAYACARIIEGVRFSYRQSEIHKDYLFWLYEFFLQRGYCSTLKPRRYTRIVKGKELYGYEFNTFTFRSFKWIHKLFYKKGVKYINPNLELYLTPLALAVWIMDSHTKVLKTKQLAIFTSFKKSEDLKILVNILTIKFGIYSTEGIYEGKNVILINKESVKKLQTLVEPFILPSLKYKVGLSSKKDTCLLLPTEQHSFGPALKDRCSSASATKSLSDSNKLVRGHRFYSNNSVHNSTSVIASYSNPFEIRDFIYKENKNKAGVYRWVNLITGKHISVVQLI